MATAGTLEYLITVDSSSLGSGLSSAESKVKGFGDKMSSWTVAKGQLLSKFVEKIGAVTLNFGKTALKESMTFDKAMAQYAATRGMSVKQLHDQNSAQAKEMKQMEKLVRHLGESTAFTATEAADALNYMALAGYKPEKSMKMLPIVLNLAAAGAMDLARASDMVTDSETALGLGTEETVELVDRMAKTASLTNTKVDQLGDAILTIGGLAQYMHGETIELANGEKVTIEQTTELTRAFGVMASAGVKASAAGTHLRNILLKLSTGKKTAKALKDIGVDAFDAEGKLRSMSEIFPELREAFDAKRYTEQQRLKFFGEAFNVRDVAAMNALLGRTKKEWQQLGLEIQDSVGAAQQMAEVQLDNLEGDVTKFKSALGETKLAIIEGLTPTLRKFVQAGTNVLKRLTDAFKKKGLRGAIEEADKIFTNLITNLKKSDNPVLQKLGQAFEFVRNVGKEVYGLITDFPGKLQEWKESDSAGLRALSDIFSALSDAATVLGAAFDGGLQGAIDALHDIGTPISETAAAGLEVFKSVCETVSGNSDIGGIIETIAKGFLLLKGVEISASLITFIAKLTAFGSLKNLGQLANMFKNGNIPGLNSPPTGTNPPVTTGTPPVTTGTTPPVTTAAPVAASTGSKLLPAIGAGAWTVGWLAFGAAMMDAWNREDEVLKQMREKGEKELKEAQEFTENVASKSENTDLYEAYDWLTKFTTQGYEGAHGATNTEKIKQIAEEWNDPDNWSKSMEALADVMDNDLYNAFDEAMQLVSSGEAEADYSGEAAKFISDTIDALHEAVKAKLEEEAMQQEVELEPDDSEIQSTLAKGYSATVALNPQLSGTLAGAMAMFGQAKGNWMVPYDNYPSLLHRGEMVLNKSQARQFRDGEDGGLDLGSAVSSAVENAMSKVYVMLSGEKVGDLTTKRVRNNINATTYNKLRAMGG